MEHEQETAAKERVRAMAEAAGLIVAEDRLAALADAFDGARLMIARLEDLAASADVPTGVPFDPAWSEGQGRR